MEKQRTSRFVTPIAAVSLVLSMLGCSTFERTFGGPKADFQGGAAIQFDDLPDPNAKKYALGELNIRVNSDLLGVDGRKQLASRIRDVVAGRFRPWKTKDKKPQYQLVINQINSQEAWEGSGMGALIGGATGAGIGAATTRNRWLGGSVGGAAGAGAGYLAFGKESNAWAFHISVVQATDELQRTLDEQQRSGTAFDAGVGGGVSVSSSNQHNELNNKATKTYKSSEHKYQYGCAVVVDAGSFSSRSAIEDAARKKLLDRLPEAMLGGAGVDW